MAGGSSGENGCSRDEVGGDESGGEGRGCQGGAFGGGESGGGAGAGMMPWQKSSPSGAVNGMSCPDSSGRWQ